MQNLKDALECRWVTDHGSPPTTFFKELVKKMPGKLVKSIVHNLITSFKCTSKLSALK